MKIEKLSTAPDRAGRYRAELSNGSVLRLYRQTVEDFGLYSGKEMTDDDFAALENAAGQMSARMRAVRILTASSVSKGDLQRRLVQKGEDPEQAKAAVEWMSELNLIDDRKTAQQIVDRCISHGYGLVRAKQALYEKRIPKQYWDDALENYPDQAEYIANYLQSHLPLEAQQRDVKRCVDALIRRGHSYGAIRRVLDNRCVDFEEFSED